MQGRKSSAKGTSRRISNANLPVSLSSVFAKEHSCLLQSSKEKRDQIKNQVGVRLSRESCLPAAKLVRHCLPRDNTGQELASPTGAWFIISLWVNSSYIHCSLCSAGPKEANACNESPTSKIKTQYFFSLTLQFPTEHSWLSTSLLGFFWRCVNLDLQACLLASPCDPEEQKLIWLLLAHHLGI